MPVQTLIRYTPDSMGKIHENMKEDTKEGLIEKLKITATFHMIQVELVSQYDKMKDRYETNNRSNRMSGRRQDDQKDRFETGRRNRNNLNGHDHTNSDSWARGQKKSVDLQSTKEVFLKDFRLSLNRVIETNVPAITKHLEDLFERTQLEFDGPLLKYISNEIVESAFLQSLYSKQYVELMHNLINCKEVNKKKFSQTLNEECISNTFDRDFSKIQDIHAKGYGKLIAWMHILHFVEFQKVEKWVGKLKEELATNETIGTTILVSFFSEISNMAEYKERWKPFVLEHIQCLWEDTGPLSIRSRLRMMDVQDSFS
jgi:hypothetical protein